MNKKPAWVLLCLVALLALPSFGTEARFMSYPTIYGETIVFTYENDLWRIGAAGGQAVRLTSHPGTENFAKFSPDGRWLAFAAEYEGSPAVYLMKAGGGEPVRLTYTPGPAYPVGWSPDGKRVVFRSAHENFIGRDPNLYFVSVEGSALERFPLDRGVLVSFSPDGRKILYCRRGDEEYYWKRYKGGRYQDIWMYDFDKRLFKPVSDYVGKNSYPMWIGDFMYFVSDRTGNGLANLYKQRLESGETVQLTDYSDFDVMMPATDGRQIVYVHDGSLHLLDVASGRDSKIAAEVASDQWQRRPRTINPKDYIHSVDVSEDGGRVVIEARGDVFVVHRSSKRTANLSDSPGTREIYPHLSPDGTRIAFFSDRSGEYQLYLQNVEGGEWTQLTTSLDRKIYKPVWSPDGKKIMFGDKDFALFYVDLATKKLTKVDESNRLKNDEFYWEISDYTWSPDSNWIAYSFVQENKNSAIFIYDTKTGRKTPVSGDFYDNLNPCFDTGGNWLYYLSSRNFSVVMDFYEDNHVISDPQQIMAVQLRAGEKPPFAGGNGQPEKKEAKEPGPFRIDLEGLASRTYPLPVKAGEYFFLKAGRDKVLWASVAEFTEDEYEEIFSPRGRTKWDLHVFDMASGKETVLEGQVKDFVLSAGGGHMAVLKDGDIFVVPTGEAFVAKAAGGKLDLSGLSYRVVPVEEWNQIFDDAWRWYRDFFYDPGMHGRDWEAMGGKYRDRIQYMATRGQLNWLLLQMVGELCVSHTYVSGGDPGLQTQARDQARVFTGLLGADLEPDRAAGYYRLARIYGPNMLDLNLKGPLVRPDFEIKEGDYLLAINGTELRPPADYYKLLQVIPGQKISVTVSSKATAAGARTYEIEPVRSDTQLRYVRWLAGNVDKVLKATNGRVGYMHINAMGSNGIAEFDKFWRAFRYKEGLIIDVRRNSGGWTEYFLIDKLEREMVAHNNLKGMAPFRYPGSTGNGNYVVVSNENNGSDGEAFVEHFKARKLGTVVGVPSWGGLVGIINGQTTIDNGTVHQSNNAFYGREGTWWVENHGAGPDVLVDNDPASVLSGRDPQLEKAIEVILDKIKKNPPVFPPRPAYPKK